MTATGKRRVLLGRQVLDHQIVDRNGRLAGNVDDVLLSEPGDGSPPVVEAILSGRGALAHRLGGRLGRLADTLSRRLVPDVPGAGRIDLGDVTRITNQIEVARDAEDLATFAVEKAIRAALIERIPGSSRPGGEGGEDGDGGDGAAD
jgi:hypothetical protein